MCTQSLMLMYHPSTSIGNYTTSTNLSICMRVSKQLHIHTRTHISSSTLSIFSYLYIYIYLQIYAQKSNLLTFSIYVILMPAAIDMMICLFSTEFCISSNTMDTTCGLIASMMTSLDFITSTFIFTDRIPLS